MAKIDFTRDYYADLGVSPDATDADIKKQFRKLALQYHPDRNHGNEQEANDKFQIIGAAHEILSDAAQRAKYNAGRVTKSGRASGVRGNPWANAGSQFQPPPKRGNPRPASTSNFNSSRPKTGAPHTGTGRFSNFASGVPPTAKQPSGASSGAESAYYAWNNMKSGESSSTRKPTAPPPPPRASAESSSRPVPQTPTARARAAAAFGNSSKKGFNTRAHGDEAPVSSSNYSTGRRTAPMYENASDSPEESRPSPPPRPQKTPIPREKAFVESSSDSEPEGSWSERRPEFPKMKSRTTRRPQSMSDDTQRDGSSGSGFGSTACPQPPTGSNIFGFSHFTNQTPTGGTVPDRSKFPENIDTHFASNVKDQFTFAGSQSSSKSTSPTKSSWDPSTWNGKLDSKHFAPPTSARTSPTRPATARRPTLSKGSADSFSAMDVDPPAPNPTTTGPPLPPKEREQAAHARNVPVEPAKKEWRSGEMAGRPRRRRTGNSQGHNASGSDSSCFEIPPPSNNKGSEDTQEYFESIKNLRNVEPFAPATSEPFGMGSMQTDLPFQTRAGKNPVDLSSAERAPVPLDFPQPPVAPVQPFVGYQDGPMDSLTINRYVIEFQQYLRNWESWNERVVTHFKERQTAMDRVRLEKPGQGEFLADRQILEQLAWAKQDNEVRARWSQSWMSHEEQLRMYIRIKEVVG